MLRRRYREAREAEVVDSFGNSASRLVKDVHKNA